MLAEETRADNARFFDGEEVPRVSITQGLGTIGEAGRLVLLAFGAVEGPLTTRVPASALQLHPGTTVILDELAAGALRHIAEYRRRQAVLESAGLARFGG